MDKAYTSITMDDIKHNAPKENLTLSLINPISKLIMLEQNMVGKDVIGIAAVAEKVFFNLSYYWNEGIRSNNLQWVNNLKFKNTFYRILDRSLGEPKSVTKTALANVNYGDNEKLFTTFTDALDWVTNKLVEKVEEGTLTLEQVDNNEVPEEVINLLKKEAKERYLANPEVDDMISQLLSAATDNAKELLLAKINCTSDLAKNYFYLLMVGFNIKDIIKFMTSPTVNLVNNLLSANVFDEFIPKQSISSVLSILKGQFPVSNFLGNSVIIDGETVGQDEIMLRNLVNAGLPKMLFEADKARFSFKNNKGEVSVKKYKNLFTILKDYYIARIMGHNLGSLTLILGWDSNMSGTFYTNPTYRNFYVLLNYIEYVISLVETTKDFNEDLAEFEYVEQLANETTTLGSLLGFNLGFKTKKEEQLAKLFSIQGIVKNRLKVLGIDSKTAYDDIIKILLAKNPDNDNIKTIVDHAWDLDILSHFDIIKWALNNDYKLATIKFYDLIKGTWNIFDVIDKVPQYKAIFKLLNTITTTERTLITKARLVDDICQRLINEKNIYLLADKIKKLSTYVDLLIIKKWFDIFPSTFTVHKGDHIFKKDFSTEVLTKDSTEIALDTEHNRASFKYAMEHSILSALLSGDFFGKGDFSQNAFVKNLIIDTDLSGKPYLRLDLNMQNIDAVASNNRKYQECLTDFKKLSNVKYGKRSLTDWFMVYNYLVNKNMYGEYRLTSLFSSFIEDSTNKSIITDIFNNVGELDYFYNTSLEDLGFKIEDAQYYMAPIISQNAEGTSRDLMIKEIQNGRLVVKYRNNIYNKFGSSSELVPNRKIGESLEDFNTRYKNFIEYSCIALPFYNKVATFIIDLESKNPSKIEGALRELTKKGILQIIRSDC